jgi:peptide/nickel transport system ATP-binding protein
LDDPKERKLIPIDGLPPNLAFKPETCPFLERCTYRTETCATSPAPLLKQVNDGHYAACYVDVAKDHAHSGSIAVQSMEAAATTEAQAEVQWPSKGNDDVLLEVKNLKTYFPVTKGLLKRKVADIKAVDDVSFHIRRGETLGLVGESGCGKTTVARTILSIYEPTAGEIIFEGTDLAKLDKRERRSLRKKMSMIFQDPYGSLDPRQSAERIVGEPLVINKLTKSKEEYHHRVDELFRLVGLDPQLKNRFPHEFSGGQRQRIGIARALSSQPSFVVCDEAISALDVSIQAQIINLLKDLQDKLGLTYLFIAHDLAVVRHIADRVAVMYLGRIVEMADWKTLYEKPLHPYTQALLAAVPIPDPSVEAGRERIVLQGDVPSLMNKPAGCSFSNRCPLATQECREIDPQLINVAEGHHVACLKVH